MVQCARFVMEKRSRFVINLRDQQAEVADYQWTLDDEFFDERSGKADDFDERSGKAGDFDERSGKGGHSRQADGTEALRGKVEATLEVRRTSGGYELKFGFRGTLTLPCDRCLADMQQPVEAEWVLRAKLGDEYDDDGELVTVPYAEGTLDVAWHLYEFVVLAIPLRHVHADGECEE